jgi:hypothetical protein
MINAIKMEKATTINTCGPAPKINGIGPIKITIATSFPELEDTIDAVIKAIPRKINKKPRKSIPINL